MTVTTKLLLLKFAQLKMLNLDTQLALKKKIEPNFKKNIATLDNV